MLMVDIIYQVLNLINKDREHKGERAQGDGEIVPGETRGRVDKWGKGTVLYGARGRGARVGQGDGSFVLIIVQICDIFNMRW